MIEYYIKKLNLTINKVTVEEKYLLEKGLPNIVINEKEYPENTPENAKKWIYLSDVLKGHLQYASRLSQEY